MRQASGEEKKKKKKRRKWDSYSQEKGSAVRQTYSPEVTDRCVQKSSGHSHQKGVFVRQTYSQAKSFNQRNLTSIQVLDVKLVTREMLLSNKRLLRSVGQNRQVFCLT